MNPSAGIYAPIPFIGQGLHPGVPRSLNSASNGAQPAETKQNEAIGDDVYKDDIRSVKRPKLEAKPPNPVSVGTPPIAPKETPPKSETPIAPKV